MLRGLCVYLLGLSGRVVRGGGKLGGSRPIWTTLTNRTLAPPSFLVIGCTKCGTSTLHDIMLRHPEVAPACRFHLRRARYLANRTLSTHPGQIAPAEARRSHEAYVAWVEGLRREAWGLTREAMSASSPRVALAELDRAYGKWYAYNKVATYLLWRWDVIGDRGRGASADLKQAVIEQFQAATGAFMRVAETLRHDEMAKFPAARDPIAVQRETGRQYAQMLQRHAQYTATRVHESCRPERGKIVAKELRFWGTPQRVHGYHRYVEWHAPELFLANSETPPLVGDFSACLVYGCDSHDPGVTVRDILSVTPFVPVFILVVCDPARRARSYLRMTCAHEPQSGQTRSAKRHYCDDGIDRQIAQSLHGLDRLGCSASLYALDDGAAWRSKGCLQRKYRSKENAIVRGFYGDWLDVWLAETNQIHVFQLETLNDYGLGARAMDALHVALGLSRFQYAKSAFSRRINVAKTLRRPESHRFQAGPIERISEQDRHSMDRLRTTVFAAPIRYFCRTLSAKLAGDDAIPLCGDAAINRSHHSVDCDC